MKEVTNRIATILSLSSKSVSAVLKLLDNGATIPFIARYRKEATFGLDEVEIERIDIENKKFLELEKRKLTVLGRLSELGIGNEKLTQRIKECFDSKQLEDLYLPYKPKRTTKASKAKALGLEPLAKVIMAQNQRNLAPHARHFARRSLSPDDALAGARDIISEWVSENTYVRNKLRRVYHHTAILSCKVAKNKEDEAQKYRDYFRFSQPIKRLPSHRTLAIFRAEKEGFLKVKIEVDKEDILALISSNFVKEPGECAYQIKIAIKDSFKRLIAPSLESEIRSDAKSRADDEAIKTFTNNASQLLFEAPLGAKNVLAIDPGFRTGCKAVCLDKQGNYKNSFTIYPHQPQKQVSESKHKILHNIKQYQIEAIAVGNGTAGRETEHFVKSILPTGNNIEVYLISESGASIYSASEVARKEFPNLDLTYRGAISIGRRLMDPLAELVKIDPKSIGVGQYQHDVAQDKLKASLENTVSFAVNKVGVNLNTASSYLLQRVSGLGPKLASNIVDHRRNNGPFKTRQELLKVKGLGTKAFEQAAGFLKISKGSNPLDNSTVHPERYNVIEEMAKSLHVSPTHLIGNKALLKSINLETYISNGLGIPTLKDIINELEKPGLDPRGSAKSTRFDETIKSIEDLKPNMELTGIINNLTKFGAFVDIGIKENGLIHKSQIADRYISEPSDVLSLNQEVRVRIIDIDRDRNRIQLSLRLRK